MIFIVPTYNEWTNAPCQDALCYGVSRILRLIKECIKKTGEDIPYQNFYLER